MHDPRRATAVHEAGHAVIARVLGIPAGVCSLSLRSARCINCALIS